jgi:hypothetical protein
MTTGAAASDNEDEEVFGETEASLDAARDELTATVAATLRQKCGAYDPALSLLLRYLVCARSPPQRVTGELAFDQLLVTYP